MASTTYAAIHVGSNELCMKIYEMSRQNGIRQLTKRFQADYDRISY